MTIIIYQKQSNAKTAESFLPINIPIMLEIIRLIGSLILCLGTISFSNGSLMLNNPAFHKQ